MKVALLLLLLGISAVLATEAPFVISESERQKMPEWLRTGIKRAEEDYRAVLEGKNPIHATLIQGPLTTDGGTVSFQGNGYTITVMKRLQSRPVDGMLYGPILKFSPDIFTYPFSDIRFYSMSDYKKLIGGILPVIGDSENGAAKETVQPRFGPRFVAKLDSIVIPKVNFEDTTLEEAINFLRQRIMDLDPELDTRRKGVALPPSPRPAVESHSSVVNDTALDLPSSSGEAIRITFKAKNIKVLDALFELAERTNLDAYVTSQGITFVPEGTMPNHGNKDIEIWRVIRKKRGSRSRDQQTESNPRE